MYVETLFETGLFGIIAYCSIYVALIGNFLKRLRDSVSFCSKESAIMLSYIISYVLVCVADNMLYYLVLNWFVWFFIGCMLVPLTNMDKSKPVTQ